MKDTTSLSLSRETILAVAARVTLLGSGFIGIVFFARELTVTQLGTYFFVVSGAQVASQVTGGVSKGIKKRVSETDVAPNEYFGVGLAVYALYVLVVAVVGGLVISTGFVDLLDVSPRHLLGGVAVMVTLSLFTLINDMYAGVGYPGLSMWMNTIRAVIKILLQIWLVIQGDAVWGLFVGFATANTLMTGAVVVLVGIRPHLPTIEAIRRTFSFAQWSTLNMLFQQFYSRIDTLLIGVLVGSQAVGYYEVALRLTLPAILLPVSLGNSLTVKTSGLSSAGKNSLGELRNAMTYAGLIAIPLFFGSLVIGEELLSIVYGAQYAQAWPVLVGLALFQLINSYRIPFARYLDGIDRPQLNTLVNVATISLHLLIAYVLAMTYGLLGVVAATVIAEVFRVGLHRVISHKLFTSFSLDLSIVHQFIAGISMLTVIHLLRGLLPEQSQYLLVVVILSIGGISYFGATIAINPQIRGRMTRIGRQCLGYMSS